APPLLDILTAIVAAQERGFRLREKMMDPQLIPAHIVDAFVQNAVNVISQYVDPRDLSAALDKLRDLQARVAPPSRGAEKFSARGTASRRLDSVPDGRSRLR